MAWGAGSTRTFAPLHFEDLEPRRFEDMVRQLAYDFRPWRALEATGRAGSDDGFDARGFEIVDFDDSLSPEGDEEEVAPKATSDRLWLIQCKREKSITPAKIKKHLDDIPDASTKGLYGVIFVAACDFSKKTRDVFREWCSARGVSEAHIWGKAELEDQLYQPKNDGLLFAYFGFSLRIRQRSIRTELRARLAMKRKAERVMDRYCNILLRDPTDDRYPVVADGTRPPRWRVVKFYEHNPRGLLILVRRYFAYLSDDCETCDFIEKSVSSDLGPYDDPWNTEVEDVTTGTDHQEYRRMWTFWNSLPDQNQANYYIYNLIPYESILDIDEKGDQVARMPHVYLQSITGFEERGFLENLLRYQPTRVRLSTDRRIKFFPDVFPEIPDAEGERVV